MSSPNSTFIPAVVGKDQIQQVFISKESDKKAKSDKTKVSFLRHDNKWVVCEYLNTPDEQMFVMSIKDSSYKPEGTKVQDFRNLDELRDIVEELESFQKSIQFLKNPLDKCFNTYLLAHLPE